MIDDIDDGDFFNNKFDEVVVDRIVVIESFNLDFF